MAQRKYISVTGSYGVTQQGYTSYATAQELLDEMDRMGIWQTVLEVDAGNTNAMHRNHKLLREMVQLPNYKERIIPAFSLDMCTWVQRNGMRELIEMLETYRPCCVSLFPKSNSYRLKAVDMILEQISYLDPVILINYDQLSDKDTSGDDLQYLANRFPNMRFVLRSFIHSGWPFIFDNVRRAPNIYLEISRTHTMDAIDLACEFLGEDKVLFGQGKRGDGGASMAMIEYANISDEAKDKICHGNFISLFSNPAERELLTNNLRSMENKVANSLWTPFIEGKGVTDAELYDAHTHLGYTASYGLVYDLTFEDEIKSFEEDMELFNIKKVVSTVTGIPDHRECHTEKEAAIKGKEDRFKGYVRFNPNYLDIYTDEYLAERFATGYYVGLKCLPHYMGYDIRDKRYERMFQYAHDHHLPILIHTDSGKGSPLACAEMAARYPNAKVILGHSGCGNVGRAQCEELAQDPRYDNVYFEICGSFLSQRKWSESLKVIDYHRVLYGTDAPIHSIVFELARLLSEDIPDEQMRAILGGNTKRIFGFD